MAEDYYEILGVTKDSTRQDIKKAYKKLAKKFHPDNQDTGDTEKFKKINEAAAVLSDDKKKQHYDQFGTAGTEGGFDSSGFGDAFSGFGGDFGDIFDHLGDLFGGGFGGGRSRRRRTPQGSDLRYDMEVTLEEAAFGVTNNIEFNHLGKCRKCGGSGAESESDIITCPGCGGQGVVQRTQRTPFGIFQTNTTCPKCRGEGKVIKNECGECDGTGLTREKKKMDIKIPPGISDDMRLRVEGEGDAAPKGGVSGDLYVFIHVLPHKHFIRKGDDIFLEYPISVSQAALGTEIEIPTLLGKAKLKVPSGTQPETIFRVKGKGISSLRGGSKGDQLVKAIITIPKSMNRKQKKLFEDLEKESEKSGFFKNLFKD